ncbi:hypothetical protein [Mycolicibacterium neoaurum]|uniref:Transmembrane protein n=1 Tax=Mycolicibacterium neoaurum TaxID=1795 RepID=A0AAV2WHJ4_MYCNE|nr:hypothetical protein [Mycolicibacterium neoaurum]CDQ43662.1 hypothetical protein BN1047_01533 [Mycolicibacterium neoaurum]
MAGTLSVLAVEATEGGGAALDQIIGISIATAIITAGLLWIGILHRTRRITWLGNLGDKVGAKMNRPAWVALPTLLFTSTIICAMFGFIWDVSLHIGKGRDSGPLANPAHYFILVGLFLLFIAGSMAIILPHEKPGPAAIKITRTWYAPVGGILMAACGLYALIGFPLDDVWHRIFGQDVTLWGPTHLMLIGGAGLSLVAVLLLEHEGRLASGTATDDSSLPTILRYFAFGGLVIGMSVFPVEYDFGIEQFRLVLHPMLVAAAAALALIAARITPLIKRPIVFGAVAGAAIGTVGLWLESFWIDAVFMYPWPTSMWIETLLTAAPVAILMGMCGALLGIVLTGRPLPKRALSIGIIVATVLTIGAAVGNGLNISVPQNASAQITLTELPSPAGQRMVSADIRVTPADLISEDPEWVSMLSWQGGLDNERGLVVDHLERLGPGHYRTTRPIPVWGTWKTLVRVQDGRTMAAVPVFLPADPGIGATELPAEQSIDRPFVQEIEILQRERNLEVPSWLFTAASLVVLLCSLILIAALSWGAGRINDREMRVDTESAPKHPVPQH